MPLSNYQPQYYTALLQSKLNAIKPLFHHHFAGEPEVFGSPPSHYRMRAEFRMWHDGDDIQFVMFRGPKDHVALQEFPIASRHISERMPALRQQLLTYPELKRRLFQVEFITTQKDDTLASLIYHRRLDERWEGDARSLQRTLAMQVIGRSRKQKLVIDRDYVTEFLAVEDATFSYRQTDGVFTQPNVAINQSMIQWLLDNIETTNNDLLELYCGIGNFTLPLASRFRRILATEISKQAVSCAHHNIAANNIDNIELLRMSSEEFTQAMDGVRPFRRLREIALEDFAFSTVLVDPPRAGLDPATLSLASRFERILYISCNPQTLLQNLEYLGQTHRLSRLAFFDQFPYTQHMECGVILDRK